MAKGTLKRLWKVSVFCALIDETGTHTIEAMDDVSARSKAVPLFIKDANRQQDENYKLDKRDWTSGDAPINAANYRHITVKDITYCEVELLQEWTA